MVKPHIYLNYFKNFALDAMNKETPFAGKQDREYYSILINHIFDKLPDNELNNLYKVGFNFKRPSIKLRHAKNPGIRPHLSHCFNYFIFTLFILHGRVFKYIKIE